MLKHHPQQLGLQTESRRQVCSLRTKYTADKISRHASRQEREVKDDNDDMEVNDLEAPDSIGSPVNVRRIRPVIPRARFRYGDVLC